MFNVCPNCGIYPVEKRIDPAGPFAICPHCNYAHPFIRQPLFVVTGASGTGKTTTALALIPALAECVVLDQDILWRKEFDTPGDNWSSLRDTWLRMARNIGQSGRPVVLFGSTVPEQLEQQPERRYFSTISYLALHCENDALAARLLSRPSWREAGSAEFIAGMQSFNAWLVENAAGTDPPMSLFDTGRCSVAESVRHTVNWIRERL